MNKEHKKNRVIVIGIDGATFKVIDRMIDEGRLPHLRSLMDKGCRAKLISTKPFLSPVAWTSIITGVNPGKHGIFDFINSQAKDYRLEPINGSARRVPPIWSYLSDIGHKVAGINVPYSYPPEMVNGIIISGMDTPSMAKDFIYPPELKPEFDQQIKHNYFHVPLSRNSDRLNIEKNLSIIKKVIESRTKAITFVMDRIDWDFLMAVYIVSDRVQHDFWDQMVRARPGEKVLIDETYNLIDDSIGKLLNKVDDRTTIIIVSDHGFEALNGHFSLGKWLRSNGYLKNLNTDSKQKQTFFTDNSVKVKSFLRQNLSFLGRFSLVQKAIERSIGKRLAHNLCDHKEIDWRQTRAFCLGTYGAIFINVKGRNPEGTVAPGPEYESLRLEIKDKLLTLTDPETNIKVVKQVHFKEEIFFGPLLDEAPDIIVDWISGFHGTGLKDRKMIKSSDGRDDFFKKNTWWTGNHDSEGIFITAGPYFKQGEFIDPVSVMDVVPTILYLMDAPFPGYLDGKLPTAIFNESFLSKRSITVLEEFALQHKKSPERTYDEEEKAAIEKRLKDLGYL